MGLDQQSERMAMDEMRSLRNEFDRFRKPNGEFAVRTTNDMRKPKPQQCSGYTVTGVVS